MSTDELQAVSAKLSQQIVLLKEERIKELQQMEDRLKVIEEELAVMEKTDLSENAPYQVAKDEQSIIVNAILLLRKRIESLSRELEKYTPTGVIGLGTTVDLTLLSIDGSTPRNITRLSRVVKIVEHDTGDAIHDLVAIDSKVGAAISGHMSGECIVVPTARGQCEYLIGGVY